MESIQINTGVKQVMINDDPSRVITFNPTDLLFVERFYQLITQFEEKLKDYQTRAEQNEKITALGSDGFPVNMSERLALLHDACDFICERIDYVFGADTSRKAFDGARNLEMFGLFLEGIAPHVSRERNVKVNQYLNPESAKRNKRTIKGTKK